MASRSDSLSTTAEVSTTTGKARSRVRAAGGPAIDDLTLFWTRCDPVGGPGLPLQLINGLGSPHVSYEEGFVAELVGRGFSVVRFDNRDVGQSSRVSEEEGKRGALYTMVDMAADAAAVLDAVGWGDAHIFGQSMGGMIAQQLAIGFPQRVRSLISVMSRTGHRDFGRPTAEALEAILRRAPMDREGWLQNRADSAKIWGSPEAADPEWVAAKGRALFDYGIDVDGTARQYRAIGASGSRDEQLAELDVPTLVIHGSADTLIQPDGGRHTADVIPNARYVELDGFGHDLPPAWWPTLADLVADFVAEVHRPSDHDEPV